MAHSKFSIFVLLLSVTAISGTQYYHQQYQNHHQPAAADTHHVDEKDYAVDSWSPWWLICAPLVFIPLILLLCTPLFHQPHHGGGWGYEQGGHGGHGGGGYGWGSQGWKRSVDAEKEEVTGRVMKSISKKRT